MAKKSSGQGSRRDSKTGQFVVDKRYVSAQAKSAAASFLSPIKSLYQATTEREVIKHSERKN
jgi:hypothetical protein